MNNDLLYVILMIIVVLILIGILVFWVRTSNKPIKSGTDGSQSSKSGNLNSLYTGVYNSANINLRCSDGTGPNITPTILLPGYNVPPPCAEGFVCVKVDPDNEPYGYCKAKIGTKCNTIYDCAPVGASLGPTGQLGQTVFCNNVCSTRITGNLLTGCTNSKINNATGSIEFKCDGNQNLVCNNVTTVPDNRCFTNYLKPCSTNDDCFGGLCFGPTVDGIVQQPVCYCPTADSNINLQVCVYVDGQKCQYNQQCYGGVCQKNGVSEFGVCRARYLPGKPCESGPNGEDACLDGYGCALYHPLLGQICQPLIKGASGIQAPAETNKVGSLCTDYNIYTSVGPSGTTIPSANEPLLTCDPGLICNYDFSARVPVGIQDITYMKGFGSCRKPLAKINQNCNSSSACMYPGICIESNGSGICSRPQFFKETESLTIYVNNPTTEYDASIGFPSYPEIYSGVYNTLSIQLVGGGGGGDEGNVTSGVQGFYGGGGGGSGQIVGYLPADDYNFDISGSTGTFQYKNSNPDGIYPNMYNIDLESFAWGELTVNLGAGGIGGAHNLYAPGSGGNTVLTFRDPLGNIITNQQVTAYGGSPGWSDFNTAPYNTNGYGGTGYNGGGAGSGGYSETAISNGGPGDLINGGESGESTKGLSMSSVYNGRGGGIGGGRGQNPNIILNTSASAGGGGGGGSCVNYLINNAKVNSGGVGAVFSVVNGNPSENQSTPGVDYTGAGGGGGADTINNAQGWGSAGGKGYAILRFSKVYKDINYVGQEDPNVTVPPSGSSGQCTPGFKSNGIYQITGGTGDKGAEFCIPEKYYTCNTNNPNYSGGSLCMNTDNTKATGVCGTNSIGIFIPIPPNIAAKKGSTVLESFGKWHFIELPNQKDPSSIMNDNSSISVYQVPDSDPSNLFYPKTRLIFHPYDDCLNTKSQPSNFLYYTEFSTKDISPNNPLEKLRITPKWYKVLIQPSNSAIPLNSVASIKFTSGGNFGMIVNETAKFTFPFSPGNTVGTSGTPLPYNRIYSVNFSDISLNSTNSTGVLTYTSSNLGPDFCDPGGSVGDASVINNQTELDNMYINDKSLLINKKFVWDLDDTYNNSVCIAFFNNFAPTASVFNIFSASFTNSVNELNSLSSPPFSQQGQKTSSPQIAPMNVKYYTDSVMGGNPSLNFLYTLTNLNNSYVYVNFQNNLSNLLSFTLGENATQLSSVFNFNRINDLGFFDFYYATQNDQFKYVTANFKKGTPNYFNTLELQVPGYLPTNMLDTTDLNYIYNFIGMGNLDRSMYAIVNTCN